jgi:hypothetical protein
MGIPSQMRSLPSGVMDEWYCGGSGSLKGLKADVTVTTLDGTIWYWNGSASTDD